MALAMQSTRASSTQRLTRRATARPFVAIPRTQRRIVPVCAASPVVAEIVEKLKGLTLLEASELVKEIETTFGVDASAPAGGFMMAGAAPAAAAVEVPKEEEQTAFDVILESFDTTKKIVLLKTLRGITNLGLNETKQFIDNLPKAVTTGASKEDAEKVLEQLTGAGATAKIV